MSDRPGDAARWSIPRWVLEAWIWVTVPAAYLDFTGCPVDAAHRFCTTFSNRIGAYIFTLFPGEWIILFRGLGADLPAAVALSALVALLCHLLVRRFVGPLASLKLIVLLFAAATGLTWLGDFIGIPLMFGYSPWVLLGGT